MERDSSLPTGRGSTFWFKKFLERDRESFCFQSQNKLLKRVEASSAELICGRGRLGAGIDAVTVVPMLFAVITDAARTHSLIIPCSEGISAKSDRLLPESPR